MKLTGKITFIGYVGIGLGILFAIVGIFTFVARDIHPESPADQIKGFLFLLSGLFLIFASYISARKQTKK